MAEKKSPGQILYETHRLIEWEPYRRRGVKVAPIAWRELPKGRQQDYEEVAERFARHMGVKPRDVVLDCCNTPEFMAGYDHGLDLGRAQCLADMKSQLRHLVPVVRGGDPPILEVFKQVLDHAAQHPEYGEQLGELLAAYALGQQEGRAHG